MKLSVVTVLILGMICNCALAAGEGPIIPFGDLSKIAAMPLVPGNQATSGAVSTASSRQSHPMTRGGKIMTGVGVGFVGIGVVLIGMGAATDPHGFMGGTGRAIGFGGGAAFAGVGAGLILVGVHQRSTR